MAAYVPCEAALAGGPETDLKCFTKDGKYRSLCFTDKEPEP